MFENHRKSLIQPFNIASEASYVYISSGQKIIKNAKNNPFWRVFDMSVLIGQKMVENAKIQKFKCDIFGDFQTMCSGFGSGFTRGQEFLSGSRICRYPISP